MSLGGWVLADIDGGREALREMVHPALRDLVDDLDPVDDNDLLFIEVPTTHFGTNSVAAFFVAETAGSESAAVRACIGAVRALHAATRAVATRHDLAADEVTLRAGLHWGATLYIGSIITSGRSEVTALGDEVNEAARIEACASGGRALASKALLERLNSDDAAALDIDPNNVNYTQIADLETATEKARRDAPAIAVSDMATASH